ncbi:MAG: ABC transporter permease subunit [Propionibacteriaceae bacterium]|jgi:D-methionine transport system permease protein|nr:ABC transporter permease subunit [Propionibacteriaceae bacterium]
MTLLLVALENTWRDGYTDELVKAIGQTLLMVAATLLVGGLLGLVAGLALYATRRGGLFKNRPLFLALNFLVNTIRPIPFIIFLTAVRPLTIAVTGHSVGVEAAVFPMVIVCTMATSRLVEQSLVGTDPGIVEAGRAMGASRLHVLVFILIPEALAPLILGYAFLFIGVLDMSAMAGAIGAGGLGTFALSYGYNKYNDYVTWASLAIIIVIVQIVQAFGNSLARRVLHK